MKMYTSPNFYPELEGYAGKNGIRVMQQWGIPSRGMPVATPAEQLGAVWCGTKDNQRAETPALYVVVDEANKDEFASEGKYFIGVLLRSMIVEAEDPAEEIVKAAYIPARIHNAEDVDGTPLRAALESIEEYFAEVTKPGEEPGLQVVSSDLL